MRTGPGEELLRDGDAIQVRPIRPDDKEKLNEHFHSLSLRSVYTRFFSYKRELSATELAYFTEMDGIVKVGLAATLQTPEGEKIVGVGRYFRADDRGAPHQAEVAFAVSDEHQHRGIASLLLDHLASIARAAGITEFSADVLGDNHPMMHVFSESGFPLKRSVERGVYHLTFPTAETPAHQKISEERHAAAERAHDMAESSQEVGTDETTATSAKTRESDPQ